MLEIAGDDSDPSYFSMPESGTAKSYRTPVETVFSGWIFTCAAKKNGSKRITIHKYLQILERH